MARVFKKFSVLWFSVQAVGQYAVLLLTIFFLLPGVWEQQIAAGFPSILAVFLAVHLFMCFFEWAFHRYVLHSLTVSWLARFSRGHRNHHGLTPIRLRPATDTSERVILNEYPITEAHQYEDSAFPIYSILAFWLLFTPLLIALQFMMPGAPILMGGYAAITFSMFLYEVLHAIEHRPYEWWKRATEHRYFGFVWKKLYGFHHMHHARNVSCNEAISGFFGLPIADWAFGTYHQPKDLLLDGRVATARDFAIKPPHRWVRWIDDWARKREAKLRRGKQ